MCLYAHTDVTCGFPPAVIAEILICNGLSTNSKRLDRVSRIWKGVKGSDKEENGFISVNDTGSTRISNFRHLRHTCEVTSEPSTRLKSTYQYEIIVCANRRVGVVSRAGLSSVLGVVVGQPSFSSRPLFWRGLRTSGLAYHRAEACSFGRGWCCATFLFCVAARPLVCGG